MKVEALQRFRLTASINHETQLRTPEPFGMCRSLHPPTFEDLNFEVLPRRRCFQSCGLSADLKFCAATCRGSQYVDRHASLPGSNFADEQSVANERFSSTCSRLELYPAC